MLLLVPLQQLEELPHLRIGVPVREPGLRQPGQEAVQAFGGSQAAAVLLPAPVPLQEPAGPGAGPGPLLVGGIRQDPQGVPEGALRIREAQHRQLVGVHPDQGRAEDRQQGDAAQGVVHGPEQRGQIPDHGQIVEAVPSGRKGDAVLREGPSERRGAVPVGPRQDGEVPPGGLPGSAAVPAGDPGASLAHPVADGPGQDMRLALHPLPLPAPVLNRQVQAHPGLGSAGAAGSGDQLRLAAVVEAGDLPAQPGEEAVEEPEQGGAAAEVVPQMDGGVGPPLLVPFEDPGTGLAESVDALLGVPHDEAVAFGPGEGGDDGVLGGVDVLVLVHEDQPEPLLQPAGDPPASAVGALGVEQAQGQLLHVRVVDPLPLPLEEGEALPEGPGQLREGEDPAAAEPPVPGHGGGTASGIPQQSLQEAHLPEGMAAARRSAASGPLEMPPPLQGIAPHLLQGPDAVLQILALLRRGAVQEAPEGGDPGPAEQGVEALGEPEPPGFRLRAGVPLPLEIEPFPGEGEGLEVVVEAEDQAADGMGARSGRQGPVGRSLVGQADPPGQILPAGIGVAGFEGLVEGPAAQGEELRGGEHLDPGGKAQDRGVLLQQPQGDGVQGADGGGVDQGQLLPDVRPRPSPSSSGRAAPAGTGSGASSRPPPPR